MLILQILVGFEFVAAFTHGIVIPSKHISSGKHLLFNGPGSGYIITAGGYNDVFFNSTYVWDFKTGKWTDLPPLPRGQFGFNLVSRASTVYAVGGANAGFVNTTLMLSIKDGMWKTGSKLIYDYRNVLSASFDGAIYALGGVGNGHTLQRMGSDGTWTKLAPSVYAHSELRDAIAVLDDKLYVLGCNHTDEVYHPPSNTWTPITMTNQPRCGGGIVALDGYIYVIGGAAGKNERYDPANGDLINIQTSLYSPEFNAGVVTDGTAIYVIGGHVAGARSNLVQVYWPNLDVWQSLTQYPISAEWMGAVYVKEMPHI